MVFTNSVVVLPPITSPLLPSLTASPLIVCAGAPGDSVTLPMRMLLEGPRSLLAVTTALPRVRIAIAVGVDVVLSRIVEEVVIDEVEI